jgi:quinol monooxygenase YgiN
MLASKGAGGFKEMAKFALYVPLKAKAGKEADVEALLKQGAQRAQKEKGTVSWYALQEGERQYSVFDTFEDEAGARCSSERRYREGADGELELAV